MKWQIAVAAAVLSLAGVARAAPTAPPVSATSRDGDVVAVVDQSAEASAPTSVPTSVARLGIGEAQRWAEEGHPGNSPDEQVHSTLQTASVTRTNDGPAHK
jgi:hypothetical protein